MTTEPVAEDTLSPVPAERQADDAIGRSERDVLLRCLADLG